MRQLRDVRHESLVSQAVGYNVVAVRERGNSDLLIPVGRQNVSRVLRDEHVEEHRHVSQDRGSALRWTVGGREQVGLAGFVRYHDVVARRESHSARGPGERTTRQECRAARLVQAQLLATRAHGEIPPVLRKRQKRIVTGLVVPIVVLGYPAVQIRQDDRVLSPLVDIVYYHTFVVAHSHVRFVHGEAHGCDARS